MLRSLQFSLILLIQLLFGVIVGIGTVLLIIPGLIIGVYLAFTYLIVALRKIGLQAFQYSINLVKGQWWRVFWIFVGIGIITFAFNYLLGWVIRISTPYIGFGTILISLIGYLVALLFAIYQVVFFLNQDYLKHPVKIDPSIPEQGTEAQIVES